MLQYMLLLFPVTDFKCTAIETDFRQDYVDYDDLILPYSLQSVPFYDYAECEFPFEFNGKTYDKCTWDVRWSNYPILDKPWCMTRKGTVGICNPACENLGLQSPLLTGMQLLV